MLKFTKLSRATQAYLLHIPDFSNREIVVQMGVMFVHQQQRIRRIPWSLETDPRRLSRKEESRLIQARRRAPHLTDCHKTASSLAHTGTRNETVRLRNKIFILHVFSFRMKIEDLVWRSAFWEIKTLLSFALYANYFRITDLDSSWLWQQFLEVEYYIWYAPLFHLLKQATRIHTHVSVKRSFYFGTYCVHVDLFCETVKPQCPYSLLASFSWTHRDGGIIYAHLAFCAHIK